MPAEELKDMPLRCASCHEEFAWTKGEQEFYKKMVDSGRWEKAVPPSKCLACRKAKVPMRPCSFLEVETIVNFVNCIEDKKGFRRRPDLILRHMFEEIAEASAALWKHEEEIETIQGTDIQPPTPTGVARELVDLLFLASYMADVLGIDLNDAIRWRMKEVAKQYDVECQ